LRPLDRRFRPEHHEALPIPDDATARAFVAEHHYAHSYPSASFRFGLYHRDAGLVSVAAFSHPCSHGVLTTIFPGAALDSVELSRFVLLDEVGTNGQAWFLGRRFAALGRQGFAGVVSKNGAGRVAYLAFFFAAGSSQTFTVSTADEAGSFPFGLNTTV
jgi:hypothetical protein